MTYEEVCKYSEDQEIEILEFLEYNTLRALPYMGGDAPIILYTKEF